MNWQPKDFGLSYEEAAHGIQSAIAHEIGLGRKVITPKHMRTVIELSRADQGGLALLLIAKGGSPPRNMPKRCGLQLILNSRCARLSIQASPSAKKEDYLCTPRTNWRGR